MDYRLYPLGDQAVVIELGETIHLDTHHNVRMVSSFLDNSPFDWMIEYVPAFTTVTVFYDPLRAANESMGLAKFPYDYVCEELNQMLPGLTAGNVSEPKTIDIPVCYGGEAGPDLKEVAEHNGLTPEEVINIHKNGDYLVYMIGFAPGFPYIGGMSEKIAAPRKKSPRLKIPAGTVGIAGKQTGVYPIETPGGWQLIGKTPVKLFRPQDSSPSLLQAGDKIRFKEISLEEFKEWEENG